MDLAEFKLNDSNNSRINETLTALDLGPLAGLLGQSAKNQPEEDD